MDELFHYCSTEAFVSIIQTNTIRLSSLRSSNDSMEGRLVSRTIDRMAAEAMIDQVSRSRMTADLEVIQSNFDGLGFCLSEDGDMLSQWRGYAEDGTGLAIGFRRQSLESLGSDPFTGVVLEKIEYDLRAHEDRLWRFFDALRQAIATGDLRAHTERIKEILGALSAHQFFLKAPAFREEREWRLISILIDDPKHSCEYRSRLDRIVPYRVLSFQQVQPTISSVVLGPKHATPVDVVRKMLARSGFPGVAVRESCATYG